MIDMINVEDRIYLISIFGPREIEIRHWRSMALHLNFQSNLKKATIENLMKYVANCIKADEITNSFMIGFFKNLLIKPTLSISQFEFLFDHEEKMLSKRLKSSGLFDNNMVDVALAKNQSIDIKLCYLMDISFYDINSMSIWLQGLARDLDDLLEFKKDIKWFNSHKKLEVASRVFKIKLGAPHMTKAEMESYLFDQYPSKSEKRKVLDRIRSNYHSLMHREKSDKKQLNVYIDLKIFENIEKIMQENNMTATELMSFIFDPKNEKEIKRLIFDLKQFQRNVINQETKLQRPPGLASLL